jgi:predicted transcriptional regulator
MRRGRNTGEFNEFAEATFDEIAEELGVCKQTAMNIYTKALQKLAMWMQENGKRLGDYIEDAPQ